MKNTILFSLMLIQTALLSLIAWKAFNPPVYTPVSDKPKTPQFSVEQQRLYSSNRDLDVALEGSSCFFQVKIESRNGSGYAYTRNGNLFINQFGRLCVGIKDGIVLQPPIVIPVNASDVTINSDGIVEYLLPGQLNRTQAGQIQLASFRNPHGLGFLGDGFFVESPDSGSPVLHKPGEDGIGLIRQGFLEEPFNDEPTYKTSVGYLAVKAF